jgi:hypothetical protein
MTTLARTVRFALALTSLPACTAPGGDGGSDGAGASSGSAGSSGSAADSSGAGTAMADSSGDGGGSSSGGGMADPAATTEFFARWPGLWVGPVDSMTSAGDFPTMNMDVRPAGDYTLFSRVDLDGGNSLRFAIVVEQQGGEDTLVFRNGGYFLGILRDSRTGLVEADLEAERFRFCALEAGCDYIDATFDFEGPDQLDMHVEVKGKVHFDWPATRAELREIDGPFPVDDAAQPGDEPFPDMPTLDATLSWTTPLEAAADAWVILSTTACGPGGGCTPSRFIRVHADAAATSAVAHFDQIHPGDYKANAILDRNGNLGATFLPDAGDAICVPNTAVTIAAGANDVALPLLVEL